MERVILHRRLRRSAATAGLNRLKSANLVPIVRGLNDVIRVDAYRWRYAETEELSHRNSAKALPAVQARRNVIHRANVYSLRLSAATGLKKWQSSATAA